MTAIAAALAPHKTAAQDRAVEFAAARYQEFAAELIAANMELEIVAPRPHSFGPKFRGKIAYKQDMERHNRFIALFAYDRDAGEKLGRSRGLTYNFPCVLKLCEEKRAKWLAGIREQASLNFDAYVAKLEGKVGEHVAAEYTGRLWQESFIKVTKADGSVQNWKTQMIINISVLGNLFNQWPTRMVK